MTTAHYRLTNNGKLDATFGTGGVALFGTWALDGRLQPDGKVVVAGQSGFQFKLARYTSDGKPDPTFGSAGVVSIAPPRGFHSEAADSVAQQSDGKLVVASEMIPNLGLGVLGPSSAERLLRFNADGSPDRTFGRNGEVITQVPGGVVLSEPSFTAPDQVVTQADDKILLIGDGSAGAVIERFNANGAVDPTFGKGGTAVVPLRAAGDVRLALGPANQIVVAGDPISSRVGTGFAQFEHHLLTVVRLTPRGQPDHRFGINGRWPSSFIAVSSPGLSDDYGLSMAFQSDGSLLVGTSVDLTRLVMTPTPTFTTDLSGRLTIYGSSGADSVTATPIGFYQGVPNEIHVSINGIPEIFYLRGTRATEGPRPRGGGVHDIRLVWIGHGIRRHVQPPISGTFQQLFGTTKAAVKLERMLGA